MEPPGHLAAVGSLAHVCEAEWVLDFTVIQRGEVVLADCTVEASSFDAALQLVLPGLHSEGLRAVRVEVDEEGLALLQAVA